MPTEEFDLDPEVSTEKTEKPHPLLRTNKFWKGLTVTPPTRGSYLILRSLLPAGSNAEWYLWTLMYVMTTERKELMANLAHPNEFRQVLLDWIDKLDPTDDEFNQAVDIVDSIQDEHKAAKVAPVSTGESSGND